MNDLIDVAKEMLETLRQGTFKYISWERDELIRRAQAIITAAEEASSDVHGINSK